MPGVCGIIRDERRASSVALVVLMKKCQGRQPVQCGRRECFALFGAVLCVCVLARRTFLWCWRLVLLIHIEY